ncbi:MAG: hypothetical protein JWR26_85 [Pedosphaera sp.]|nr:hypothetical protein [Pedosphaera sp.]
MGENVAFWSPAYFIVFSLLAFARAMDLLSTRVATPNLVLEGNPIAKKLGWNLGMVFSAVICIFFAHWPVPATIIITSSTLVAARNFQQAWLMRSMGEESYRNWHVARMQETRLSLYLFCLAGQTALTASVGGALIYFSAPVEGVPMAIGVGIVAYAGAVAFFTLLSVWRMRSRFS